VMIMCCAVLCCVVLCVLSRLYSHIGVVAWVVRGGDRKMHMPQGAGLGCHG
jgi:hypothetical protein